MMYKDELSIFIPNSFLSESKDLKVRTYKVGVLGRALAVFQADNVVIYNDDHMKNEDGESDGAFMAEVLSFMDTPQYLRKQAFPIKRELKHVGILPPLRTPHHPLNNQPEVGDYRQGFTVKRNNKGTFVDIGMDKLAFCKEQLSVKQIFDFKIVKIAKKEVIVTPDKPDDVYWGYNVISSNKSLKNSLKPYSSIHEDVSNPNWDLIKLNTIPGQGTETVRTEEAVVATLSLFNFMRY